MTVVCQIAGPPNGPLVLTERDGRYVTTDKTGAETTHSEGASLKDVLSAVRSAYPKYTISILQMPSAS